jgi:hypothetical protein
MNHFLKTTVAILALAGATQASAALLSNATGLQAVSAVATSNYGAPYTTDRTIDQSDLSASYISGVTSTAVIDTITNTNQGNGWHGAANDSTGSITFDLGGVFTLDRIYLFWMNAGTGNNIADFTVEVSLDSSFSSAVTAASFGTPGAPQERIDFASLATGEYVRLSWTSLQGSYPGLNEFIAGGIPAQGSVPEPASLILLGLGLAGLAASRRRKQ